MRGALVGFGAIAENAHVPAFAGRADMRIAAVCELSDQRRAAAQRILPDARVYSDVELMLDKEGLDFVIICTPPHLHGKTALSALKRRLHVLCEKPLTLDVDELETLAAEAARAGKALFTVHNWAYSPQWLAFETLARAARPEFASIEVRRTQPSVSALPDDWRRDLARAGGGILVDHGWHNLYLLRRLFDGPAEVVETRLSRGASGADEEARLVLAFGAARAELRLTWRSDARSNHAGARGAHETVELRDDRIVITKDGAAPRTIELGSALSAGSSHPEWLASMLNDFAAACAGAPARARNLDEARFCAGVLRRAYAAERAPA